MSLIDSPAPTIPDLDPRADAHIWGPITPPMLVGLLVGWAAVGILWIIVGAIIGHGLAALILGTGGVIASAWAVTGGPSRWVHARWRRARQQLADRPWPDGWRPAAAHAADPVWVAQGCVWAMATLTTPATEAWDPALRAAWHARLAQAVQLAATSGCGLDIIATQAPRPVGAPDGRVNHPVLARRWQYWTQVVAPAAVHSIIIVRLVWPWSTSRDEAWQRFEGIAQAWDTGGGDGQWLWLSAAAAQDLWQAAASPADDFHRWAERVLTRAGHPA